MRISAVVQYVICPILKTANVPSAKIPFINSEKIILDVNNLCTNIRVHSNLLGLRLGFRVRVRAA